MKLGTETGSLINHLMSGGAQPPPALGMGVTILLWTDREAATIVDVQIRPDQFTARVDTAVRIDSNGMSECQEYRYSQSPNGRLVTFRRVARGKHKGEWREDGRSDGHGVLIGRRESYHDFSF